MKCTDGRSGAFMRKKHTWAISWPVYFPQRAELMVPSEWHLLRQNEQVFKDWNSLKWLFFRNPRPHTHTHTLPPRERCPCSPVATVYTQARRRFNLSSRHLICRVGTPEGALGPERKQRLLSGHSESGFGSLMEAWHQRWCADGLVTQR